jgi:hypothetical protein
MNGARMGKNKRQGGRQQGATRHAAGQQGPKTHARQAEIAHSEKTRLARDLDRHGHTAGDELSQRNESSLSKRKS